MKPYSSNVTDPLTDTLTKLSERPDTIANRYDVQGLLGVGGMGSVYRVFDRELREVVALKFLNPELLHSPAALD